MNDPEPIDDLILRSILGETTRQEEKELREAFAQDPTLLERRKKLVETAHLLAEVHGVPSNTEAPRSSPVPIWLRSLRGISSVGSGIAAGLILLFLLFPSLDRVQESNPIKPKPALFEDTDHDLSSGITTTSSTVSQPPEPREEDLRKGVASAPPPAPESPQFEFEEFNVTGSFEGETTGNRQAPGSSFMRPQSGPSPESPNASPVIADSSTLFEEDLAPGLEVRDASYNILNASPESEPPAETRGPIAGSGSAPTVTTAPTRSDRRGGASAPPAAPQSPQPPAASPTGSISYEEFVKTYGDLQRESTRNEALGQVTRSWGSSRSEADSLSSGSLTAEFDMAKSDRARDFGGFSLGAASGYVQPSAPMDDPFAAPHRPQTSPQPARSQTSFAGEKAKVDRLGGDLPLMGQLFADETPGQVTHSRSSSLSETDSKQSGSLTADYEMASSDVARDFDNSSSRGNQMYRFRGESAYPSTEETAKMDGLRIEPNLRREIYGDEYDGFENSFASETDELKKREVAPKPKPAPKPVKRPAPPPAATFTDTEEDNFSTFSLNVADVSFQLAARQLEQGIAPDPVSIRQEEFYNAFDYRDPSPASGEPVRFEVESATLPASHNLKVVRLAVKTAAQSRAGKPAQITFAIDNSGSMQRSDRKRTIEAAFEKLTDGLRPQDRINIVTFATDSRVDLLQSSPSNSGQIQAALNSAPEGGTNLENGLTTAYEMAARYYQPAYENRVILLSDGIANLGQTEADQLVAMIEKFRNQGIAFDGFGIGWENLNDPLLSELARNGDGQYAFLNSPEDAGALFAQALSSSLQSVARDVKVQVEWNPDRVQRFRLIGYDTHLLNKEDFRNDAVDAAEMAAEETGNALYLVELKPNGSGPLGTARVRFKMEEPPAPPSAETERILEQLESVVIPRATFLGTSLPTAAQALTDLIAENNSDNSMGVSIVVSAAPEDRQVNFSVRNLPAIRILDIMSQQTGYHWNVTDNNISFSPPGGRSSTNEDQSEQITVEERSWIIPNPPVWPEIDSASARLQLSTAAAIFADKLQNTNRFSAIDRAQLLAWTQQAQSFFNYPAEIETLANMIRNANFLP